MSLKMKLLKIESEIDALESNNPDDPRIDQLSAEADKLAAEITAAEDAFEKRQKEEVIRQRELGLRERIVLKTGDYLKWIEWAESLYPIKEEDGKFTVTSNAIEWNEEKSWGPFSHKIEALEKIEQLINYKIYDRNRGRGNTEEDLNG